MKTSTICLSAMAMLYARAEEVHQTEDLYTGLEFRFGVKNIPHFEKVEKGGEDAWVA